MKALLLFFVASTWVGIAAPGPASKPETATAASTDAGEIGGAKYFIRRPTIWNHHLLLIAHGLRPESAPLEAEVPPNALAYKALLDDGWMVAATSFRRNGMVVMDGIKDLDALVDYITEKYQAPDRVVLEGESMGGLMATIIAERGRDRYSGVVAIGAALQMIDPTAGVGISMHPQIPIIFLTNETELGPPRAYLTSKLLPTEEANRPLIFLVKRNGHVNVNQQERLVALRALNTWIESGRAAVPKPAPIDKYYDATYVPPPVPSRVKVTKLHEAFEAHVTSIVPIYGNFNIDAQPGDFDSINITQGFWFKISAHGTSYRALYGRDFGSVKNGEWVAYPNADGTFLISRNNLNAAKTASLKVGDVITVESFGAPPDS